MPVSSDGSPKEFRGIVDINQNIFGLDIWKGDP